VPLTILTPGLRSGADDWLIWTSWQLPTTAYSDNRSGSYTGGIVPVPVWSPDPTGTLVDNIQVIGDGLNALFSVSTGTEATSQYLVSEFTVSLPTTSTVNLIQFRVNRFTDALTGGPTSAKEIADLRINLVVNDVVLTAINKKPTPAQWAATIESAPEVIVFEFTEADLATLGVTATDIAGATFGIAIQAQAKKNQVVGPEDVSPVGIEGRIGKVEMRMAYTTMTEGQVNYCEIPTGSQPSPWLVLKDFTGGPVPVGHTIVGIQADVTAYTGDGAAQAHAPTLTSAPATGTFSELEVALSLDGVNPVGETWLIYTTDTVVEHTSGAANYLWAHTGWLPASFAGTFALLVRRPATPIAVSSNYVTNARVRVTTTSPEGTLTMSLRQELTEVVLLGVESTPGTTASAFYRLRALNYKVRPNVTNKKFRPQGEKMEAVSLPMREWVTGSISGMLDFNELPLICEAVIGAGVHSGTGTINTRNVHTYLLDNRIRTAPRTFSCQRGEKASRAHQANYLVHNALSVQITTSDCQVSGSFFAQALQDGVTLAPGANEIQTPLVTGTPTGGTYRLAFKGAETTDLAYNANATAVEAALLLLSTIGTGNIQRTNTGLGMEFIGTLAGANQPMLTLVKNQLTGGTTPSVTFTQTQQGGYTEYPLVPVVPKMWSIYLADTQAGLTAGKLTKAMGVAAAGFDIADRHNPVFYLDRDIGGSIADTTEMDPKFRANLTVGANSLGMALLTTLRAGATKWLRLEAVGPVIGATADTHQIIWEGAVKIDDAADFGNEDGRVIFPWPLVWVEGPNGEVPTLTIINGVVSY
jgi:hypothetical protein